MRNVRSFYRVCFAVVLGIFLFSFSDPVANADPARGLAFSYGKIFSGEMNLLENVRVVCEQRKEGDKIRTFFCPDGNSCYQESGSWKCRAPKPAASAAPCDGCSRYKGDVCFNCCRCRHGNQLNACKNNPDYNGCLNRAAADLGSCNNTCK